MIIPQMVRRYDQRLFRGDTSTSGKPLLAVVAATIMMTTINAVPILVESTAGSERPAMATVLHINSNPPIHPPPQLYHPTSITAPLPLLLLLQPSFHHQIPLSNQQHQQ
jgi:hypothetical protein